MPVLLLCPPPAPVPSLYPPLPSPVPPVPSSCPCPPSYDDPLSAAEKGQSKFLCNPVFRQQPPTSPTFSPSLPAPPNPSFFIDPEPLDPGDATTLDEEAARYHPDDWPPLALASAPSPPVPSVPSSLPSSFSTMKTRLTSQIQELTEILQLQERFSRLSALCRSPSPPLSDSCPIVLLTFPFTPQSSANDNPAATPHPPLPLSSWPETRPAHSSHRPVPSATPNNTRSGLPSSSAPPRSRQKTPLPPPPGHAPSDSDEEHSASDLELDNENKSEADDPPPVPTVYRRLPFKKLEKLNAAVKNYGPNAPFTLSMLESFSGDGFLTPNEWISITKSVLTRGQFLTWRANWADRC